MYKQLMIFRKEASSTTVPVVEIDKEVNNGECSKNLEESDQSETENETGLHKDILDDENVRLQEHKHKTMCT